MGGMMDMKQEWEDGTASELDFTQKAINSFYDAVDDPYFRDQDPQVIFNVLKDRVKVVAFGDFLKRYIYQKAEMSGGYQEIPLSEYQDIICCQFADRQTPASFTSGTTRIRNSAKNWLEQQKVNRNAVLLLGFGLGMSVDEVNEFLEKSLREQHLNAKDPFEVVCWYCYRNGYGYPKFEQLWKAYQESGSSAVQDPGLMLDATGEVKKRMLSITDETQLMTYLRQLPIAPGTTRQSVTARKEFDRIYDEIRDWVAEMLTEMEKSDIAVTRARISEKLDRDDRKYDFEKVGILENAGNKVHEYQKEEIRASDVEQFLFASVPKDKNGNLLPMKASSLNSQFGGSRLSRQHLADIISGGAPITRYDLITLNFLSFARKTDEYAFAQKRYSDFVDSTNAMLEKCDMGPVYPVNPYENFLMMCILSVDPIGTFSDVWELSYSEA